MTDSISVYKFRLRDSMLRQLADVLRGNTTVSSIDFPCRAGIQNADGSQVVTDAGFAYLARECNCRQCGRSFLQLWVTITGENR